MKGLAVTVIAAALATSAIAQETTIFPSQPQSTAFGVDPIMRVTSIFRTTMPTVGPQAGADAVAQEAARRELYRAAANECRILSEIFNAECRVSSVTNLISLVPNEATPANQMTATASYELRLARASGR
jgi:hypothetical protein